MRRAGIKDEEELAKAEDIFINKEKFIENVEFSLNLKRPHY